MATGSSGANRGNHSNSFSMSETPPSIRGIRTRNESPSRNIAFHRPARRDLLDPQPGPLRKLPGHEPTYERFIDLSLTGMHLHAPHPTVSHPTLSNRIPTTSQAGVLGSRAGKKKPQALESEATLGRSKQR